MASVTGSRLAFFAPGISGADVNVVLTPDGTGVAAPIAGKFNIEVFTSAAGGLAPGYQASAFIQDAIQLTNNLIQAGTINSTEQLLAGNYTVIDQTGSQTIQIVGNGAGGAGSSTTVVGSSGDKISGSSIATNSQLIDVSGTNPSAIKGAQTVTGGAGNTTVWAGTGGQITGGTGAMTVAGINQVGDQSLNSANNKVSGGAGNLTVFDMGKGNVITGSTSGFTYVDDNYAGGGGNTITGGAGNGPVTNPGGGTVSQGSWIIGGQGDLITGGTGTILVNALNGNMTVNGGAGAATVWGATGDKIFGGSGAMQVSGNALTATGGTGSLFVIGGSSDSVIAGGGTTTVIAGAGNTVTGGVGTLQLNQGVGSTLVGGAGSVKAFDLGTGNSITGSTSGPTSIDDSYTDFTTGAFTGGANTLVGGAGSSTIIAGPSDSIVGGAGALEVILRSNLTGSETINLSAGASSDGVRDDDVAGTSELGSKSTVFGFQSGADFIRSATSVAVGGGTGPGALTGTATAVFVGGNTVITFNDLSTMTVIGVAPGAIKFTQ